MKKTFILVTLFSLISLSGCTTTKHSESSKDSTATTKSSKVTSSTKQSTESTSTVKTSSTLNTTVKTESATEETTTYSTIDHENPEESQEATNTPTQQVSLPIITIEQAQQRILETQSAASNPEIVLEFYKQIGPDFLFSLRSNSIKQQGGSGSAGFYRVNPQGDVFNTDSFGNVY